MGVCFSLDLSVVRDTWRLLPASILYGLTIVVSAGTLMLALSSMSRRSLYVGLTWVALFLIGWVVASALGESHANNLRRSRERKLYALGRAQIEESQRRMPAARASAPAAKEEDPDPVTDDKEFSGGPMPPSSSIDDIDPLEAQRRAQVRLWKEMQEEHSQSLRNDWRPLFSYTANLDRLGEALLNTDAAWAKIGHAYRQQQAQVNSMPGMSGRGPPPPFDPFSGNERSFAEFWVPQYPWTWSAGVLAGIWGISVCILSTRVKSLDRLK